MADLMINQLTTERLPAQVIGNEWIAIDVVDPLQPSGYKTMKIRISSLPQGGGGGGATYELVDNGDNTFQLVENGVPILPVISMGSNGGYVTVVTQSSNFTIDNTNLNNVFLLIGNNIDVTISSASTLGADFICSLKSLGNNNRVIAAGAIGDTDALTSPYTLLKNANVNVISDGTNLVLSGDFI